MIYLPSCHSTNTRAAEIVQKKPVNEGAIFITDHQHSGRGQRGNQWESEPYKNYTFSIFLRPSFLNLDSHFYLNIIISMGLVKFLSRYKDGFEVKWPNDIYYKGKKIAGILIENSIKGNEFQHCIVGVGLNINQKNFNNESATSLSRIIGRDIDLILSFEQLLLDLEYYYSLLIEGEFNALLKSYHEKLMWMNEPHQFKSSSVFEGVIKGINQSGQLMIESNAELMFFNFKEVEFAK